MFLRYLSVSLVKFYNKSTNELLKEMLVGQSGFTETIENVENELKKKYNLVGRNTDVIRWDITEQLTYDIQVSNVTIKEVRHNF